MARIFQALAAEKNLQEIWDNPATGSGYDQTGYYDPSSSLYISGINPRSGDKCYIAGRNYWLIKTLPDKSEIYMSLMYRNGNLYDTGQHYIMFGGSDFNVRWNSSGYPMIYRGTGYVAIGSVALTPNQWDCIEIWNKPLNSNGRFVLKINGVISIDFTGDTVQSSQVFNGFSLGDRNTGALGLYDNILVNDTSGSVDNTWIGQPEFIIVRPLANGSVQDWTRGGVDTGSNVGQLLNSNGMADAGNSYLQTSTDNHQSLFTIPPVDIPAGATISAVSIQVSAMNTGAGVNDVNPTIKSGATTSEPTPIFGTISTAWKAIVSRWATDPNTSAAWTEANVQAIEVGVTSEQS
ncbi:MAG: hypothetical protein HC892_00185 [Saprospiraceae bacterium]|nr:hypothetical protein [Saprospiraceae bacterium]